MQNATKNIRNAITGLLSCPGRQHLKIEGCAERQWFALNGVELARVFNTSACDIMVKFFGQSDDPIILVPDTVQISADPRVCPKFIETVPCLKGWRALCPHMFHGVADELLQFIACLRGFLADPSLCGCMGCPGKDTKEAE